MLCQNGNEEVKRKKIITYINSNFDTNITMMFRLLYYMWIGSAHYFYSRPSFITMDSGRGVHDELQVSNQIGQLFATLHEGGSIYSNGYDTRYCGEEEEKYEKMDEALLYEHKRNILRKHLIEQLQDASYSLLYKEDLMEKYSFLFDFERKTSNTETTYKVEAPCMKKGGLLDDWEF